MNNQITYNKKEINDQSQIIEDLKNKLLCNEHRLSNSCTDLNAAKERIKIQQGHMDKLQRILEEKTHRVGRLMDDNKILKVRSLIFLFSILFEFFINHRLFKNLE